MPVVLRFGLLALLSTVALLRTVEAAELIMFEEIGCEWCERWDEDIGGIYAKTDEGRRAPLRRILLGSELPSQLKLAKPVTYTPTFVLVEDGKEIGRVTGYPGPDFFWPFLNDLLKRLPAKQQSHAPDRAVVGKVSWWGNGPMARPRAP